MLPDRQVNLEQRVGAGFIWATATVCGREQGNTASAQRRHRLECSQAEQEEGQKDSNDECVFECSEPAVVGTSVNDGA